MRQETVLREAEFDPKVVNYWLLSGTIVCCITVVGIPIGILWFLVGRGLCLKYLSRVACILTDRSLIIRKGMFNRVEKTIPLDKITDLAMLQGPIMRAMGLKGFRVETAGGAGAATGGYLVQLTGIVNTDEFRDAVLTQRDAREDRHLAAPATPTTTQTAPAGGPTVGDTETLEILREIRDSLKAIEARGT